MLVMHDGEPATVRGIDNSRAGVYNRPQSLKWEILATLNLKDGGKNGKDK